MKTLIIITLICFSLFSARSLNAQSRFDKGKRIEKHGVPKEKKMEHKRTEKKEFKDIKQKSDVKKSEKPLKRKSHLSPAKKE